MWQRWRQKSYRSAIWRAGLMLFWYCWSTPALAWGSAGHQIVAGMAEKRLGKAARAEVKRLLALEPGQTLASISTWADEHRNAQSASWHYVNLPRGDCAYSPQRDCPDGHCVVAVIERQAQILASDATDAQRLLALKYLVHFVADVHQPLHAGYADDRGGNSWQLQAFGRGTNLHALWDTGLLQNLGDDAQSIAARLDNRLMPGGNAPWTAAQAAQESCRIVASPGFYPGRFVDAGYLEIFRPVIEDRLVLAAVRLADLLNRLLRRPN
jgi:hypothetical protein